MNKNHTIFFNPLLHDIPYEYHDTNPQHHQKLFGLHVFVYTRRTLPHIWVFAHLFPSRIVYIYFSQYFAVQFSTQSCKTYPIKTGQKVLEFRPGLSHSIITSSDSTFCRIAFLRTHLESTSISQNYLNITLKANKWYSAKYKCKRIFLGTKDNCYRSPRVSASCPQSSPGTAVAYYTRVTSWT